MTTGIMMIWGLTILFSDPVQASSPLYRPVYPCEGIHNPEITYLVKYQGSESEYEGGWQRACDGLKAGTTGESLRLESIAIRLRADIGSICYQVHVSEDGWLKEVCDGTIAGNGQIVNGREIANRQIEAIQITSPHVSLCYRVHMEDAGWSQEQQCDGIMAGSTGRGRRLEAICISTGGINTNKCLGEERLNEAVPSELISVLAPVFDFDGDGCLPSAGINRYGEPNKGLKIGGTITGQCRARNFLETSNTLHRSACSIHNDSVFCGHFYALYFKKDQTADGICCGHRHDWEHVAIWTTDGIITHGSVSEHGGMNTRNVTDIPFEGTHMKVVYHKDDGLTHAIRFAQPGEIAENPTEGFVTPPLASWYSLTGDALDNAAMRERLNRFDYGSGILPIKDGRFYEKLNEFKPSNYPVFLEQNSDIPLGDSHGVYQIVSANSGLCLDISAHSIENGGNIQQYECHYGNNQRWQLVKLGSHYKIVSVHSGLCLDVSGHSVANGGNIQQYGCHYGKNQRWRLVQVGSEYEIISVRSGLCLDVTSLSVENGGNIQQYGCHQGANQRWRLVQTDSEYEISAVHSGLCLDVTNHSVENGGNIQQYRCHQGDNQRWRLLKIGSDYEIISVHSGLCLDVSRHSVENGGNIQQYECHHGDNQLWRLVKVGNDYEIMSAHSGLCLDAYRHSTADGTNIQQYGCHHGNNQQWRIVPTDQPNLIIYDLVFGSYVPPVEDPLPLTITLEVQIWEDKNRNGLQDEDERGISGVTIRLLDALEELVSETKSDVDGLYSFTSLAPGNYVRLNQKNNYTRTREWRGGIRTNHFSKPGKRWKRCAKRSISF
ncbi:RICIN domain-containing protein [Chloroflexi bacterium TSY]|nr:RICIN domain-containing protein [Chloroflexi bacterium TSY]